MLFPPTSSPGFLLVEQGELLQGCLLAVSPGPAKGPGAEQTLSERTFLSLPLPLPSSPSPPPPPPRPLAYLFNQCWGPDWKGVAVRSRVGSFSLPTPSLRESHWGSRPGVWWLGKKGPVRSPVRSSGVTIVKKQCAGWRWLQQPSRLHLLCRQLAQHVNQTRSCPCSEVHHGSHHLQGKVHTLSLWSKPSAVSPVWFLLPLGPVAVLLPYQSLTPPSALGRRKAFTEAVPII